MRKQKDSQSESARSKVSKSTFSVSYCKLYQKKASINSGLIRNSKRRPGGVLGIQPSAALDRHRSLRHFLCSSHSVLSKASLELQCKRLTVNSSVNSSKWFADWSASYLPILRLSCDPVQHFQFGPLKTSNLKQLVTVIRSYFLASKLEIPIRLWFCLSNWSFTSVFHFGHLLQ